MILQHVSELHDVPQMKSHHMQPYFDVVFVQHYMFNKIRLVYYILSKVKKSLKF